MGRVSRKVAYGEGRDLLVAATVQVVADKGLRGLTFRAVADLAGVNNSLVAHHFGTREALLAAALEWAVERSIETTGLLALGSGDAFVDSLLASITDQPELQAFQYEMILEARRNPLFRPDVERLYDRYQHVVEQSLAEAGVTGDVAATARRVFATLDGLVLQYIAGVDTDGLRRALHDLWSSVQAATRPNVGA
ncbi:TetR/AcrR family transcriptional regulator [Microbacterium rhizosphaerae]|uniref:TetR/AcrR family transcriptional regulator n=1 Tax=Microbacterium rhizosphaerae TaxID=1678237 RepID=UPI003384ECF6